MSCIRGTDGMPWPARLPLPVPVPVRGMVPVLVIVQAPLPGRVYLLDEACIMIGRGEVSGSSASDSHRFKRPFEFASTAGIGAS